MSIKRIALYVIYDQDGKLDRYREYFLKKIRKFCDKLICVVQGSLDEKSQSALKLLCDDFLVRDNTGSLTYAWIDGLNFIGWDNLKNYDELLMLNDSFFGPFFEFDDFFTACEKSDAQFYGMIKNFEEKSYHDFNKIKFKHDYFRGSICYFYVIKSKLLHSKQFKAYWSNKPTIKSEWDVYFYNEFNFYDEVIDWGFKVDSYQSDKLKGYFFDNLSYNMAKLIKDDKIPCARIRPFGTNMKDQSLGIGYGTDPREALDYIEHNTSYDTSMMWEYLLRTKNLTHIWDQMQLEYVISDNYVEKAYSYNKKIAVILHIYYTDLVENMASYCQNFPENTDFFITTINEDTQEKINEIFTAKKLNFISKRRPNIGVAMTSLWITYADIVSNGDYEYICYFHDKKSPYKSQFGQFSMQGEKFALRCYENLFGTKEVVKNIINLFEDNKKLGILGAPIPYNGQYFLAPLYGWKGNFEKTKFVAEKLGLKVNIDENIMPVSPYGDMFWFRSKALKKAIDQKLTFEDFNEPYKPDFTIMHAFERIYGFCAQDAGFYYADVITTDNARTDLVNYQHLLYLSEKSPHQQELIELQSNSTIKKHIKADIKKYSKLRKLFFLWPKKRAHYEGKLKKFEKMLSIMK